MGALNENALALVARVAGVNLNAVAATNLFIVPQGKILELHAVHVHSLLADAANAEASVGQSGDPDDFIHLTSLELLDAVGKAAMLTPHSSQDLSASGAWDPGNILDHLSDTTTIAVVGAQLGDYVSVSFSLDQQGLQLTGYVDQADQVTVVLSNSTGGALNLGNGTLSVTVTKRHRAAGLVAYTAGEVIVFDVQTAAGGASTCEVDLFGVLHDA